jgi:hypothetical protein
MKSILSLAVATTFALGGAAFADDLIGSYTAYISQADIHNSKGQKLTQVWQILRQDRANFHKFGIRDPEDETDIFFASLSNREKFERMILNGGVTPGAKQMLLNGGAMVFVEVFGRDGIGYSVHVTVTE